MKLYQAVFFKHESQIVFRPDGEIVIAHPAKLHGLPFESLDDHVIDFVEDAHRRHRSKPLAGPAKKPHGKRVHGIAGVHGNRDPSAAMHRRRATPQLASVFNVVVHEKGVVQHFQPGRRVAHVLRAPPKRTRGRNAQRRAQALARTVHEILHEPIQMTLRLPASECPAASVSESMLRYQRDAPRNPSGPCAVRRCAELLGDAAQASEVARL